MLLSCSVFPPAVDVAAVVAVVVPVATDSDDVGFTVFSSVSMARSMNSGSVVLLYGLLMSDIAIQSVNSCKLMSWCLWQRFDLRSANLIAYL